MTRNALFAAAIAAAAAFAAGPGAARADGLRVENVNGMQEVVGGAAPAAAPRSGAALRLENANGMQEVVYDAAEPPRPAATGGAPRLVNEGGGDHSVAYGR